MIIIELVIIAFGLAMDAFAASICKGLSFMKFSMKKALIVALYFGIFQAVMPFIGYSLGAKFEDKIIAYDHWIAFILLLIIGLNMIREAKKGYHKDISINNKNSNQENDALDIKSMTVLATATSIDALIIGVTFAFLKVDIFSAIFIIGIITFIISIIGVKIGSIFGTLYKSRAEFFGGVILILMGLKILLEHTGIL